MTPAGQRDTILQTTEKELSEICRITFTKGSGPGGQKRNKTSSAVKVELTEFGISASDCTERSQFRNRSNALRKLKMQLALKYRVFPAVPPENMECSLNSDTYALFAARLLDVLEENSLDHRKAAAACCISPTALLKKLYRDPELWTYFRKRRQQCRMPLLNPPE